MNISCGVMQDLLPLYHDQACSAESQELVRDHLAECAACRRLLADIGKEPQRTSSGLDEAKPLRAARAAWSRGKKKSFWKGIALAAVICAVLVGAFMGLTQWRGIPVDVELLQVTETCQLEDGRVSFRLQVKDNKELRFIKYTITEDGAFYMTPMRAVLEGTRMAGLGGYDQDQLMDLDWMLQNHPGAVITSCYVGPVGEGILVWEEGMDLPPASAEIEQQFDYN